MTTTHAIEPPAWHGTLGAQIAWAGLVLALSLLAFGLRSGIPAQTAVAVNLLALLSLPVGLWLIIADDGQGIPTLANYPLPLWLTVALTTASIAFTARLVATHARPSSSPRRTTALAALATASALLIALVTYWLL